MVVFGRQNTIPLDVITNHDFETHYESPSSYVQLLENDIRSCHLRVRESTGRAALREKRHYDRKHFLDPYKPGDLVLLKSFTRLKGCAKFQDKYLGPFAVTDKLSDIHFRIQQTIDSKPQIVHHNRLKRYFARNETENDTKWVLISSYVDRGNNVTYNNLGKKPVNNRFLLQEIGARP